MSNKYKAAEQDYISGMAYKDIADKYGVSLNTVKSWKRRYAWDKKGARKKNKKARAQKKRGAPYGNHNAAGNNGGAPIGNHNAVKHGLYAKYLPQETLDIVSSMSLSPLDILWEQIQLAYAAIMRAQQINYVRDRTDITVTRIEKRDGNVVGERWEVQQAWDKQNAFLKAQARAQAELRAMIRQYDEMVHANQAQATEEQQLRIRKLQLEVKALTGDNNSQAEGIQNFIKATKPTEDDIAALYGDEANGDE